MRTNLVNLELEDLPDTHTQTLKYIEKLENRVRELKETAREILEELIDCSYELQCLCGHPACRPCQRYGQLAEFIEKMKKVV